MTTWRSTALSALCGFVAIAILAWTIAANYQYGASSGSTEIGQLLLGLRSTLIEAADAALWLCAGYFITTRQITKGVVVGIVGALCMIASTIGVSGFDSNERLAKSAAIERRTAQEAQAAKETNAAVLAARREQLSWLRQTTVNEQSARERRRLAGESTALAMTVPALRSVPTVDAMEADSQSATIATLTGYSVHEVQLGINALFSILLAIAKSTLWFACSAFSPRRPDQPSREMVAWEAQPEVKVAKPIPLTPVPPDGGTRLEPDNEDDLDASVYEAIVADGPEHSNVRRRRDALRQQQEQVATFFGAMTRPAAEGLIHATDLWRAYEEWALQQGLPVMTQKAFGNACSATNVSRRRTKAGHAYAGLALVPNWVSGVARAHAA